MTASLLLFIPVALLVLISGFCFVGCAFDSHGTGTGTTPSPFTTYSGDDVLKNTHIAAYWPLDEATPADDTGILKARDATGGGNDGQYKHKGNAPGLFPCPAFQVGPGTDTAAANGFLSLGQVSLLAGDVKQPGNDPNIRTTGMDVDGAFVTVPYSSVINPGVFTVEAWVRPEWDLGEQAYRAVVDSRDLAGGVIRGFVLWVNEAGNWEGAMADVNGNFLFATASQAALGQVAHLAFTFDGTKAAVFVNGVVQSQPMSLSAAYSPNTTQPLIIGAGGRYLMDRMNSTGNAFFPIFPFKGSIQDVAIYSDVLDPSDILKHYNDGIGNSTEGS